MAGSSAIADVGQTLVGVLRERMEDLVARNEIALASPDSVESGDDIRLTLYLYSLSESPHLKNERTDSGSVDRSGHPLALDLHYLLTAHPAHSGADETARTAEQHSVLGRAMQVLQTDSILRGSDLKGSLDNTDELHVTIEQYSTDAIANIWTTFQEQPFRPSVSYIVTPVIIESTRKEEFEGVVRKTVESYSWGQEHQTDE